MLTEDWVETIKRSLSPSAFKDVAIAALRARYGSPVELTDGTGDGGVDAWIVFPSGRVPVQFHSGRSEDWDAKLRKDLGAHDQLKASGRLFFVCAQTPAYEVRQRKLQELMAVHRVVIDMLDAREIASSADDHEVQAALRRAVGIPPAEQAARPWDPSTDARLAFTFFHEKSGDFRAEVARSVLSACLLRADEPVPMEALLDEAITAAKIGSSVRRTFRRELETLASEGKVTIDAQCVTASVELKQLTTTALDIQARAADRLREDCVRVLEKRVHSAEKRAEAVKDVFDDLGLLLRGSLAEVLPGRSSDALVRRLNAVERRLSDYLKPAGGSAAEATKALVDAAAASSYGRALAAAELFIQMADRESGQLATALVRRDHLTVWLDASIALPMLCGNLDHVAEGWAASEIAVELHGALRDRGIKGVVPSVYLEEMAAHLVDAARNYRLLVGQDADLARSANFYVAHFHAVAARRGEPATLPRFDEWLADLGLPPGWEGAERDLADYQRLRRTIERTLEDRLRLYGVGIHRVRSTVAVPLPEEPGRDPIVLQHDQRVARDLEEGGGPADEGVLLCSEDRWLVRVLAAKGVLAIHPAALLDVLQIVRPRAETRRLANVRELAATFSERAINEGAAVWDVLAELEGTRLSDRDLLRRAKEFKTAWLGRANHGERPRAKDWQRFKDGLSLGG